MKLLQPRLAAWLVPIVCFSCATLLIAGRHVAFSRALAEEKRIDRALFNSRQEFYALAHESGDPRFVCAARKPGEASRFLSDLRRNAAAAGVTIVQWRSEESTFGDGKPQGPPSAEATQRDHALKGVTEARCALTLGGDYAALRDFLRLLWKSNRLYVLSEARWSRSERGNELTMTLCRYIAPDPSLSTQTETPSVAGSAL